MHNLVAVFFQLKIKRKEKDSKLDNNFNLWRHFQLEHFKYDMIRALESNCNIAIDYSSIQCLPTHIQSASYAPL